MTLVFSPRISVTLSPRGIVVLLYVLHLLGML